MVCVATDGAVPLSCPPEVRFSHAGSPVAVKAMVPVPPLGVKVWEYATPEVVGGNVDGENVIAGFTDKVNGCVLNAVATSVTVTLNDAWMGEATAFGVPLITPALLSDIPGGTDPLARVHTKGAVPPVRLRVRLQNVPAVQSCNGPVLIAGTGLIVMVTPRLPVSSAESVTVMVPESVPAAVGVPVMPEVEPLVGLTESPGGSPAADQV